MKTRIYTKTSAQPYVQFIETKDMTAFIELLKDIGVVDAEGQKYVVTNVVYDAFQNAVDINCGSRSSIQDNTEENS